MTIKMDMKGMKELDDKLKDLPRRLQNRVLQKATDKAIAIAFKIMQRRAPKHVTSEQSEMSKKFGSILANLRIEKKKNVRKGQRGSIITTGNAFWAFFFEKGSRHQAARPWFLPSFSEAKGPMLDDLGKEIGAGLEKEAAKNS